MNRCVPHTGGSPEFSSTTGHGRVSFTMLPFKANSPIQHLPPKKNCSKAKVTFHFLPPTTTHHQILWVGVSTNSDSRRISSPHPLSCIKGWILGRRERKGKEDIYENERKRHRETMGSSHGAHTSRNTIKRYRLTVSGRGTCT